MGEYLLNVSKNLIFNKFFRLPEALDISNKIMEQVVYLFVKCIKMDNLKLAECFATIVDPTRIYFKTNNQAQGNYNVKKIVYFLNLFKNLYYFLKMDDEF